MLTMGWKANYILPLKHFAMQNFYGSNTQGVANLINHDTCKSITILDMFGGVQGNSANVFIDDTWKDIPPDLKTKFRATRCNEPAPQQVNLISQATGLEKLYFVNTRPPKTGRTPDGTDEPETPDQTPPAYDSTALAKQYIYAITRCHGSSMKHLTLRPMEPVPR